MAAWPPAQGSISPDFGFQKPDCAWGLRWCSQSQLDWEGGEGDSTTPIPASPNLKLFTHLPPSQVLSLLAHSPLP